jgi:hypothetical protein
MKIPMVACPSVLLILLVRRGAAPEGGHLERMSVPFAH